MTSHAELSNAVAQAIQELSDDGWLPLSVRYRAADAAIAVAGPIIRADERERVLMKAAERIRAEADRIVNAPGPIPDRNFDVADGLYAAASDLVRAMREGNGNV